MSDLIDRQAAIDCLGFTWPEDAIRNLPATQPEPKKGKWKRKIVDNGYNADWVCSECGYRWKYDFINFNFCPNCGADMRGDLDE